MNLEFALIALVIIIFSAVFHEVAHGWVADRLGDPTARLLGRLTLNPVPHIDPLMSILLPLVLILSGSPVIFGAAKPVPVDPFNLRDGRRDMALVSMAGPLTNFLIAAIAAFLLKFVVISLGNPAITEIVFRIVQLNLLLGIFNLLPVPPLDGSKVFALFLPEEAAKSYLSIGTVGIFIIFFLLLFPIGGLSLGAIIFRVLQFSLSLLGL
ncbi:MAG: site-2 protease family protein [Candidatus Levybacteria bacterium]|nr:site-2 protease family protein [Candidatus Levybacteria bacterium]